MTKIITIFGGSGFIGRHLVRRLAKTGATIRVPTRDVEKALALKPMGDVGQIVPATCSVRSDAGVAKVIAGSDTVINLLGLLYEKGRDNFQSVHVEAAARIARLAKEEGARNFAHVSTLGANAISSSAYARSKAAGEQAVRAFFPGATIFRPSVIFGPEDNFFNLFATVAKYSPVLPLIGGGKTKFQPVYVGDVAAAIIVALESERRGELVELGGPQIYTFRELLEFILCTIKRRRLLVDVPFPLASLKAFFMEFMPHPLLTRDQVKLLKMDNVVSAGGKNLRDLCIEPTALEVIVPSYLKRFVGGG